MGTDDTVTVREAAEVDRANASDAAPVVFVHGLWLLASSWDPWRALFEEHGYMTIAVDWPDDPETVEQARANPQAFAGKTVEKVTDHIGRVLDRLNVKPIIIGHSFGGLITQKLAGRGRASISVPIDPAPARGVLPLPISALRAASPVLANPLNRTRAVMLTYQQFRYAFANAVDEAQAKRLYETYAVPAPGAPLFQAAFANVNPASQASANTKNADRGPMKFISGGADHTVPWAITNASYKRQRRNSAVTEIENIPGRGHSLVFDDGWLDVAKIALDFIAAQKN